MKRAVQTLFVLIVVALGLFTAALTLAQDANSLAGTRWELVAYGDPVAPTPVIEGNTATLEFSDGERLGGNGTCNNYGSSYTLNGDALTVQAVVSTMMACMSDGLMEQEIAYFAGLQAAVRYEISGDQLVIEYGEGQQMVFKRARDLTDGSWQLITFVQDGEKTAVVEGSEVTVAFDSEGRITGSGGCNSYGGGFSAADNGISFSETFSTERACLENGLMAQEQTYLAALTTATRYAIRGDRLVIDYGDGGQLVYAFVPGLTDTPWQLESFVSDDLPTSPVGDSPITLEFVDDGRVAGSAGCNRYGGTYVREGDSVSFSELFSTRRACPADGVMAQEQAYLNALESATGYSISDGKLIIRYGDGLQLVYVPAPSGSGAQ